MEIVLSILSCLMILSVVISMIHKSYWVFRVLEYPRLQKFVIITAIMIAWLLVQPFENTFYTTCFIGLGLCISYLSYKIFPYTFFNGKEVKNVTGGKENTIGIFAANVYQENRQYSSLLDQVKQTDPDIIFLLETDEGWAEAMKELKKNYPYTLFEPLGNTYGLLFFTRLKLVSGRVQYLVKNDIPSVDVVVKLESGQMIQLYGLHPEPPVPGENLYATAKDKELMKVALKVRESHLPCIVFGDLNDVAWSHTTMLFRKTSELLDPRRGRGFYSTFSAKSSLVRFPLDYIFCSNDFGLAGMQRMPKNGSDHFAVFTKLCFLPVLQKEQPAPKASTEELSEAKEKSQQPLEIA